MSTARGTAKRRASPRRQRSTAAPGPRQTSKPQLRGNGAVGQMDRAADYCAFETRLGWMAVAFRNRVLLRLSFGHASQLAAIRDLAGRNGFGDPLELGSETPWPELAKRLAAYAAGDADDFADIAVDVAQLTTFERRVIECCRHIPYGQTLSYGQLAQRAGAQRAARGRQRDGGQPFTAGRALPSRRSCQRRNRPVLGTRRPADEVAAARAGRGLEQRQAAVASRESVRSQSVAFQCAVSVQMPPLGVKAPASPRRRPGISRRELAFHSLRGEISLENAGPVRQNTRQPAAKRPSWVRPADFDDELILDAWGRSGGGRALLFVGTTVGRGRPSTRPVPHDGGSGAA